MKRNLLKKESFVCFAAMTAVGLASVPFWSWTKATHYEGDFVALFIFMSVIGGIGAVGVFDLFMTFAYLDFLWETEKKLIRAGWRIHHGWGIFVGLSIMLSSIIGSAIMLPDIFAKANVWAGIFCLCSMMSCFIFGSALCRLHNKMPGWKGVKSVWFF